MANISNISLVQHAEKWMKQTAKDKIIRAIIGRQVGNTLNNNWQLDHMTDTDLRSYNDDLWKLDGVGSDRVEHILKFVDHRN
jgi:hypothetical protein